MMTYDEAVEQARSGKGFVLSNAGGWTRRGMYIRHDDGRVTVRLFRTIIAIFAPEYVAFNRGGYDTATTREAIRTLAPFSAWASATDRVERPWGTEGVWTVYNGSGEDGFPFVDRMAFRYDGSVADGVDLSRDVLWYR